MAKKPSTSILNLLPEISYTSAGTPCLNIFVGYNIIETYKKSIRYYYNYSVGQNDRWEKIAFDAYGNEKLWWIIAMFNNIKDPFQELDPDITTELKIIKPEFISDILVALKKVRLENE